MDANPLTISRAGHRCRAGDTVTMHAETGHGSVQWAALQQDWRNLTDRLQPRSPFMHWEWLSAWHQHFAADYPLTVLVSRQDDRCTGILPLVTHIRRGRKLQLRTLRLLGTGLSDQLGLMSQPADTRALAGMLYDQRRRWDLLELKDVEADDPAITAFCRALINEGLQPTITPDCKRPCLTIDEDWHSYYARVIGKKTRRRNQIQQRKLESIGRLSFETVTSVEAYLGHLPQIRKLHERHFNTGQKRQRPFDTTAGYRFFHDAGQALAAQSMLALHLLKLDDRIIAYDLGFRHNHRYLQYFGGYDNDYARYSPGRLLQVYLLRWCFDTGFSEVDFGRGDHDWKRKWTSQTRENVTITVPGPTLMSRLRRTVLMH